MRVAEIRMLAFGPFTNRTLDLTAGNQGFHVIFGPNEAGKTSALRAIHALLYGIPAQTPDAFLHPYENLRVGGRLRLANGTEIDFTRRKGSRGTLLDPQGSRLDDHALSRFLAGVGADQFRMFWGIDLERLVEGGRDILVGRGDLGESLFAAGSGASHLRALREALDKEAGEIFAPQGRSRAVNVSVAQLRDFRKEERELAVSADKWVQLDRQFREAEDRQAQVAAQVAGLSGERARLERVKRVLPLLAERDDVRRRLSDLRDVRLLAPDFGTRRQQADTAIRVARENLARTEADRRELEALRAELGTTPVLATESDAVERLHGHLGSHSKAMSDRTGLVQRAADRRDDAKRRLSELRPDMALEGAERLRVFIGRRARIQKLASERERLDERQDAARRAQEEAREKRRALEDEALALPSARDPERLIAAIERARERGDVEAEREKTARAVERLITQRDVLVAELGLPESVLSRLEALRVPSPATLSKRERQTQEIEDETRAAAKDRQRKAKDARELDARIETLRTKHAVPTEEELAAVRKRRDAAFELLRELWERQRDVAAELRELLGKGKPVDLYLGSVRLADEVADRLRNEAERVAELAQRIEDRKRLAEESEAIDAATRLRDKAREELETSWRQDWKSALPTPPPIHEAPAWCERFTRLRERVSAHAEATEAIAELESWIESRLKALRAALKELGDPAQLREGLAATVSAAEKLRKHVDAELRAREEHARRASETERAARDAGKAEREAEAELAAWQGNWREAVLGLVDGDPPQPDDALSTLDAVERILRALDEAGGYADRIAAIDQDADSFRVDLRMLAERLGDGSARGDQEAAWVESIYRGLGAAQREEARRAETRARLEALETRAREEGRAVESATQTLAALRAEAGCGADEDLASAERRSTEARVLRDTLARCEQSLLSGGDGASIPELEAEAKTANRDVIDARLEQLRHDVTVADASLSEARDARAGALAELRRLGGPSAASEKEQDVQATLARLGDEVIRYSRLRIAATLLTRRIEDYRRRNQAPLLLRAGTLFRELTTGRFEALEADVEDDRPILVGVRPGGVRVPVQGMSDGTTDQLFLALRLAAVEASCVAGEPMPFIVDDILVKFDDERSAAALRVLAQMAAVTQVILFTHHDAVRRSAEGLSAPIAAVVHHL